MESNPKSITKWQKFKKWCYVHHQALAICMMIILIIIGIWFNPFDDIVLMGQSGGGKFGKIMKELKKADKYGAELTHQGGKAASKGVSEASGYVLDKFRDNSSLIYEVFYQLAFVVVILLIVFPTIGFFIIGIICFIILRDKLAYLKSL